MRGFCAKCGRVFDGQMLCPRCGVELAEDVGAIAVPPPPPGMEESPDGPSFIRRMALGGITLLGLYHGLKHLALAGALAYTATGTIPLGGLICLLVVATLAAAVAAGTVNRRAEVAGLLLAAGASAGFLAPQFVGDGNLPQEWPIGLPTLLAVVGVVGGTAGRLMIPPAPVLPRFSPVDTPIRPVRRKAVRLSWWRIFAGTAVVVIGINFAEIIRHWLVIGLGGGSGALGAAPLMTWEISMIATLIGGVTAGANTRAGFRQGFFAGLVASAATLVAVTTAGSSTPLVLQFWLDQLEFNQPGPLAYIALAGSVWAATTVGGWLGEQLLPPAGRK